MIMNKLNDDELDNVVGGNKHSDEATVVCPSCKLHVSKYKISKENGKCEDCNKKAGLPARGV